MSNRYYTETGHTSKNCWTCDGVQNCKCDRITLRAVKRGSKQEWRKRIKIEVADVYDAR